MPFDSEKQRRFLFVKKPGVARKIADHDGSVEAKMGAPSQGEGAADGGALVAFAEKGGKYTKPGLRERLKNEIMRGGKGGDPGEWSARKAQLLTQRYKAAGGGFKGAKSKGQKSLKQWGAEDWQTSDGKPAKRKGGTSRYLPKKAWESMSEAEKKATNRKKREGDKKGKQHVRNTKAAKEAAHGKFSGVPGQASTGMGGGGQLTPEMVGFAPTPGELKAALTHEKSKGSGSAREKAGKVANHLQERPSYYVELGKMLDVPIVKAGPYRGPRGGLYADAQLTQPYREGGRGSSLLEKAKYTKRVPYTDAKGRRRYRYYYSQSSVARGNPDAIKKQGQAVVDHVRKTDPALAQSMEQTLGKLERAARAKHSSGQGRTADDPVTDQAKAFGRAFNQAAAPASILGPELGGLLREVGEEGAKGEEKKPKDALASTPQGEVKKAGPFGVGGRGWGPVPTIAPIMGSAPRDETPAIPDYQEIYHQPKGAEHVKREKEHRMTRRLADAKRVSGVFGFHGEGDVPTEPILQYGRPGTSSPETRTAKRLNAETIERRDAGRGRGGTGEPKQTDAGRVSRSPDRRGDLLADVYGRPVPIRKDADADEDEEEEEETKKAFLTFGEFFDLLEKAKYTKRVPYTDAKGRRRYRYYYSQSSVARGVQEGEDIRLGKQTYRVEKVGPDGDVTLEGPDGKLTVRGGDWSAFMARHYGDRYQKWASQRAQQSINAVYRLVPKSMLAELKGDTDEERLADLKKRAPEVFARLSKAFSRSGIGLEQAKSVVGRTLAARGWEGDARAAVLGGVLSKRTGPDRVSLIIRGAENLAGGQRVNAGHVGGVLELTGGLGGQSFEKRLESMAKAAESQLEGLQKAIALAQRGDNPEAAAAALAAAVSSSAVQKLALLGQAFPGLHDKAIQPAREALLAASAAPTPPKTQGAETTVFVAGENGQPKALKGRYRLMEAADVKASHDPSKGFKKRGDYPEGVQERQYHKDKSEQEKVIRNAQRFDPRFVINTNPDATNGPPQVTPDGVALGGNSRTMSMQLIHAEGGEKAAELKEYLKQSAHQFGLTEADVSAMKAPILVREVEPEAGPAGKHTKEEMGLLVRQLNESFTQSMDPRTMQVAMGRRLSDKTIESLSSEMREDETLPQFLASSRAEPFINQLAKDGVIDARNQNAYLRKSAGKTKQLNQDGKALVERVLVGRLVGDADIMGDMRPQTVAAVSRAVPTLLAAAGKGKSYDVSGSLKTAIDALNDAQRRFEKGDIPALDAKMDDTAMQRRLSEFEADLFGDSHAIAKDPTAKVMFEALVRRPGAVQFGKFVQNFADEVSKQADEKQEGFAALGGEAFDVRDEALPLLQNALDDALGRERQTEVVEEAEDAPDEPPEDTQTIGMF